MGWRVCERRRVAMRFADGLCRNLTFTATLRGILRNAAILLCVLFTAVEAQLSFPRASESLDRIDELGVSDRLKHALICARVCARAESIPAESTAATADGDQARQPEPERPGGTRRGVSCSQR